MKKIITLILAVSCIAACQRDYIIENTNNSEEITFGNSVTEFATKATVLTADNLQGFNVWGFIEQPSSAIFSSTEVTKDNGEWSYKGDARYWLYGRKHYFAAIAPSFAKACPYTVDTILDENSTDVLGELTLTNTGDTDLMYSSYMREAGTEKGPVNFKFYHLLSKIYISFENLVDPNVDLAVSNIKINGIGAASIDLTQLKDYTGPSNPVNHWESSGKDTEYKLADIKINAKYNKKASTDNLFLIPSPSTYGYTISFDITLKMKGVDEILYKATKTGIVSDVALNMGCAYNFATKITPNTIKEGEVTFEVEQIKDHWGNDLSKVFDDSDMILISSKLGGDITLSADETTITSSVDVVDDFTLNLNGKKLLYSGNNWLFNVYDDGFDGYDSENDQVINDINNKTVLTINGDGEISATGACIATAGVGGEIIINGGTHTTSGTTLYNSTGGKIEITNGSFKSTSNSTSYTLLSGSNEDILVCGGSFYMWDPSNNDKDFDDTQNFLAKPKPNSKEKLFVSFKENWYHVNTQFNVSGSKDQASNDFVNVINNNLKDGDILIIENNISIPNLYDFQLENKGSVTIDMNNNTLEGDANRGYSGLFLSNTNVTINNGNFTGGGLNIQGEGSKATLNYCNITITSANTSARHGVYAGYMAEVIFNGGEIKFASSDNMAKKRSYFCADGGTIYVIDCKCGPASTRTEIPPLYIANGGKVIIYSGTFGFNPELYVNLPEGSTSTKVGNEWIITSNYITSDSGTATIHGGTYPFDPSPWLAEGATVTKTNTEWIVTPL